MVSAFATVPALALSVSGEDNGNAQATVGNSTNVDVNITGSTSVHGDDNDKSNAENASAQGEGGVSLTRGEVDDGGVTPTSSAPASVSSNADLSGFVAAQMKKDSHISTVQTSSSSVMVTYQQPARFLGIFPIMVDVTAQVSDNGSVMLSYPWFRFLLKTNEADLHAALQSRVQSDWKGAAATHANGGASANAAVQLSAQTQARLIADLQAVLQSQLTAAMSTSATASGSASTQ
ncbi:MAG TPA: hypothetical protein VN495_01950 [Candidatus Paceibacterota bacterium]|nr:hypothetical protein [Candidatus Paceibacterota bacterium]